MTGLRSAVLLRILVSNTSSKYHRDKLQANMTKVCVWNVTNEDPSDLEDTFPLVRCPDGTTACIVNLVGRCECVSKLKMQANARESAFPPSRKSDHYRKTSGHQRRMVSERQSPSVDAKEKVNWTSSSTLLECLVKTLVARVRGAPDFILEGLVNVIFGVRFDNKVSCL